MIQASPFYKTVSMLLQPVINYDDRRHLPFTYDSLNKGRFLTTLVLMAYAISWTRVVRKCDKRSAGQ